MEQRNANTSVAEKSIVDFAIPQQKAGGVLIEGVHTIHLPLRFAGGNLGLGFGLDEITVYFVDAEGKRFKTESVQWLLTHVEDFVPGRDQDYVLAGAATQYGLGPYALMGFDFSAKWNVVDEHGNVVEEDLARSHAAELVDDEAAQRAWDSPAECSYRIERAPTPPGGERHEGPLVLLHHSLGVTDFEGVAVKSHAGRCGMMLEEVLWRLDQFSDDDQAEILAGLAKHFDMGDARVEAAGAA
ncbi:hypothetical protein [Massilia sp. BKSP1R2A-1]|uniref:hypothetical protein n=1 Tax=Massilia sp. BKSP1R2A-1 TaxID=3422595 RepID=UPI003D33B6AF